MRQRIKSRLMHLIIGIDLIITGIYLIVRDHYFWWPPAFVWLANNDIFGAIYVLSGLGFLAWVFLNLPPKAHAWVTSVGCFLMVFLSSYQFLHSVVAHAHMPWVSNLAVALIIMTLAYRGDGF